MPTTVNGIGTHYYGKKNRSTRTAPCHSCSRVGPLESYDTRLWFVILFIPVIPLGRKKIIDECPSCRRHMAANADQYEQSRQLQTSGSLERYRREGTPESALGAHAQYLIFHDHDQAAELRTQALERFPSDAALRAALADQMRQVGSFDEMARLNEEALALDPELPQARAGVATWKMAHGELDEARRLLDFLEEPGAAHHYNLAPLYSLAKHFQTAGRHEEAIELAEVLLREAPALGQDHDFRDLVRKSERAARTEGSLLPARKHSLRGLFRAEGSPYSKGQRTLAMVIATAVLAAAGLSISNEYIRRHRTIRVVNACGAPVQVHVDDGPPVTVTAAASGTIPVAEGHHRIRIAGAVDESLEVEIGSGYLDRWTHSPLWVLNPGGEGILDELQIVYAAIPQPPQHTLLVGKPFMAISHVDYAFEPPPESLTVKGRNTEVKKVAVRWIQVEDDMAFQTIEHQDPAAALDFAERKLKRQPYPKLIDAYLQSTFKTDRTRAESFLKAGLDRRPLSVEWHRAYQASAARANDPNRLVAEYDALLAKEPNNAALLYLRGRVDPDPDREVDYFRRSAAADPQSPWPIMALGMKALNKGRWEEALRELRRAQELKLNEPQIALAVHTARMGLGEAEALAGEYRELLGSAQPDLSVFTRYCDALAASGHPEEIEPALKTWVSRLPEQAREILAPVVGAFAKYQMGDAEQAAEGSRGNGFPGIVLIRAQALTAAGRAAEAAADPEVAKLDDPWTLLAVALGLSLEGKSEEAGSWREKAAAHLDVLTDDHQKAAALLRASNPPSLREIDSVFLRAGEKALLLAILAERSPEKKAEYHEAAARFNVLRLPPYLIVRRANGGEAAAKP